MYVYSSDREGTGLSCCFEGLGSYASLVAGIVPMCFLLLLLTAGLAQDGLYSSLQSLLLCEGLI